jgi:hypothetical protein
MKWSGKTLCEAYNELNGKKVLPFFCKSGEYVMNDKSEDLLNLCSGIQFGAVDLSPGEKEFCNKLNIEVISLCKSMPDSTQTDALLFAMKYLQTSFEENLNFFQYFYVPAWSIIYWLIEFGSKEKKLKQEDIRNAITAHSMAMLLHPLDDQLNDGELPVTHLSLLLRSQAWEIMTNGLKRLADGVKSGERIIGDFINRYYSGISSSKRIESIDEYCDGFRNEMCTWLIVPMLLTRKITANQSFSDAILKAYESFGIAWRLLDDIQDLEIDMFNQTHSSVYFCLPEKDKRIWDKTSGRKRVDSKKNLLNYIHQNKIIDVIRARIIRELEYAADVAYQSDMTGLANEYNGLIKTFKIEKNHGQRK